MRPFSPSGCTVRFEFAAVRAGRQRGIGIAHLHRRIIGRIDLAMAFLLTTIMAVLTGGAASRGKPSRAPAHRTGGSVRCTVTIRVPRTGPTGPNRRKALRVRRVRSQVERAAIGQDIDDALPAMPRPAVSLSEAIEFTGRHSPL